MRCLALYEVESLTVLRHTHARGEPRIALQATAFICINNGTNYFVVVVDILKKRG